ncbi:MAG: putative porin [Sphingobium sp.]|jgi:hypothetical protein|nr:putative porin [Sphingobium sp.]
MAALLVAVPQSVWAQGAAGQAAPMSASTSAMVNLISLLIKQGTITPEKGMALLQQAETEAARAQGNIQQAANAAGVPTPVTAQTATADNPLPQPGEAPAGTVRVPYVPETVRKQIADQVRDEIMAKAKTEKWVSSSNSTPGWVRRVTVSGDMRVRSQSELQSRLNDTTIVDIARLGASSSPINTTDLHNLPLLDTKANRYNRMRIRARLGVTANINPNVKVGIQIATGDDNSPISTNQKLAGGFSKRDIWLDKAYIELKPKDWIKTTLGRFDNPFLSTDLLFDDDLRFDGFAAEISASKFLPEKFGLKLRGGAFPLDYGSSDTLDKFTNVPLSGAAPEHRIDPSKWLLAGQIEAGYKMDGGLEIRAAAGYYDFHNLQGQLSAPCYFNGVVTKITLQTGQTAADPSECSTDAARTMFPRKGNTLFYIRDIQILNGLPGELAQAERQYLGMTYKYRVLDLNAAITLPFGDGMAATLSGNYIHNLAFKRSDECKLRSDGTLVPPLTNPDPSGLTVCGGGGKVQSGNMGWLANLSVGYKKPSKWGEWRAMAGYRYLQTDAVPDAFPDSDFHLGGTNSKGYTIGAALGLTDGVVFSGKWMSANEVTGSPLSIDVLQFDLTAAF